METVSANVVTQWLARLRAKLDDVVSPLRDRLRGVQIHVNAGTVGSLTEFQGQNVWLEALLPSGDSIALSITAAYLTTTPRVFADVCWDAEADGGTEASTFEQWGSSTEWPVASAENLDRVEQDLSRLIDALCGAVERRIQSS
jgi:hypothetical protein